MLKEFTRLIRIIILGLAIAFVVQIFYPELINRDRVVEFIESGGSTSAPHASGLDKLNHSVTVD